ncbi:MAG TPA: hypothetical protein VHV30_13920 [Polyangiaceae bacterium]|jgi:hypothetical protein|nr:hypothetical protein [Polyangiaceae bacterium]
MSADKKNGANSELQNEGEGSRSGARRYDEGASKTANDPEHVRKAAEEARKALEGAEGSDLRKADERGKKHDHR